ncbi:DUF3489 domain-containing protein [Endozoicomonas atrinae]|uniref:DUF3489 domain-containing protein n=1 Tax=Endozoicomonas atrinae TaxID=1333660 RepID=UPI000826158F|nr:DUF3489 domain-containing protein [Endozoicomonas atrinae]
MNKKLTPKLKAVVMSTTKTGKVPAKVAKEAPKAVEKLKDEGLAKTQKGAGGKPETVLTKAGEKAKTDAQKTEKANPKKDAKATAKEPKKASPKDEKKAKKPTIRKDTKQYTILKLLSRKQGATIQQLHEATGWKLTTLRGTPGALKLKLGLEIESEKRDGKDTVYRIVGGLDGLL